MSSACHVLSPGVLGAACRVQAHHLVVPAHMFAVGNVAKGHRCPLPRFSSCSSAVEGIDE